MLPRSGAPHLDHCLADNVNDKSLTASQAVQLFLDGEIEKCSNCASNPCRCGSLSGGGFRTKTTSVISISSSSSSCKQRSDSCESVSSGCFSIHDQYSEALIETPAALWGERTLRGTLASALGPRDAVPENESCHKPSIAPSLAEGLILHAAKNIIEECPPDSEAFKSASMIVQPHFHLHNSVASVKCGSQGKEN